MSRKQILFALLLLPIAASVGFAVLALPSGTGLVAKQMCSLVHMSGLPRQHAMATYIEPLLGPAHHLVAPRIDSVRRQVSASAFGLARATAVYHPGYGCIQMHERTAAEIDALLPLREREAPVDWVSNDDHRRTHFDTTALRSSLRQTLAVPGTQALLIVHAGELVAEAYADGIDGETPLPGWSMAKTVTAVLAGMLIERGLLAADEVALFAPWEDDERVHVSFDQLLRMASGIDIVENKTGADANSRMLFQTGDPTGFAIGRGLRDAPGTTFTYTSGSTMLAARIITERLGGGPSSLSFIKRELLTPLDMRRTVLEPDETGQFVGSSFVMSSARDWARLGLMLLGGGTYGDHVFFPPSWIEYMTTPTPQAVKRPYGAGVWLIDPEHPEQTWMHKLPQDTYYASGLQTNQLWIIPSRELVIVRLGASDNFLSSGVPELLHGVLAAQVDPEIQSST